MVSKIDLDAVDDEVLRIKSAAERLISMGRNFPALARNAVRIQASLKMLELNISDYMYFEKAGLLSNNRKVR